MALLFPSRATLGGALLRLAASGYPVQGASDHGVSEAIYLADPEGNGIELYADRAASAWPRVGDTLAMVTDPLDLDDLLDEARRAGLTGGEPVESLRMGHVHLHVAQLDPAVAFYHQALGLNLVQRYGGQAAFLAAGDYHHHIGINTWAGIGAPQPAPGAPGLREFTLLLPTNAALDATVSRLRARGQHAAARQPDYVTHDPSGNRIVLHSEEMSLR
jgi:catechol 2,3-dioxygenase